MAFAWLKVEEIYDALLKLRDRYPSNAGTCPADAVLQEMNITDVRNMSVLRWLLVYPKLTGVTSWQLVNDHLITLNVELFE